VRVQVGALPTQDAAAREAERLRRSYGNVFGRVGITVVRGESGGSPIYRIQAGPVRDRAAADELCSQLRQHHVGCIIVAR
jgi:cell division septation protein DedD